MVVPPMLTTLQLSNRDSVRIGFRRYFRTTFGTFVLFEILRKLVVISQRSRLEFVRICSHSGTRNVRALWIACGRAS
jgi:hypothetical protein